MPVPAVTDSLDEVPEALHEHYTESDDGQYVLDAEGVDSLPQVRGLAEKKEELLGSLRQTKDQLEEVRSQYDGIDPDEYEDLKRQAREARERELVDEGDLEELKSEYESRVSQIRDKAQQEIQSAKEQAEAEREAARNFFKRSRITEAIAEKEGVPELLMPIVERQVRVKRTDDGQFQLQVVGEDGNPRVKDASGTELGLGDLVEELKSHEKYGRAFNPSGASGGGAPPNRGKAGGPTKSRSEMSRKEKSAYIREHGQEKFLELPE